MDEKARAKMRGYMKTYFKKHPDQYKKTLERNLKYGRSAKGKAARKAGWIRFCKKIKEQGFCGRCRHRVPDEGYKTCKTCREYYSRLGKEKRAKARN